MNYIHGLRNTSEYSIWRGIKKRCLNPGNSKYKQYGAKGITICDRWMDVRNFVADMGLRPSPQHSIDRYPDPNGNYEPSNCRWATRKEQNRNRGDYNVLIKWNGQSRSVAEWSELTLIHATTLYMRIRRGWAAEKALTKPR